MNKYLIKLIPIGSFFFGGERSFPIGKKDKNELSSYIVESNLFPQQTSLLGMLRFWLLKNSDAFCLATGKIVNEGCAQQIIGGKGFYINNNTQQESTFGKIKKIDYCFLQKNNQNYFPTPLDYGLSIDFKSARTVLYNGIEKKLPEIKYMNIESNYYSAKDGLIQKYISTAGEVDKDSIFIKDQRIGINRDITTGKTADGDLYKQICYRLNGFNFAFTATIDKDTKLPDNGQIVELGGDSSKFILEYKKIEEEKGSELPAYPSELVADSSYTKIVLLSDSRISNSIIENNTVFSISEHVPFQFLSFETKEQTEYTRKVNDMKKSVRYSLFKKGSVFYFNSTEKLNKFKKALDNKTFQQIGYNKSI